MRIIYTFHKKNRLWIIKCASDNSIKESTYNSRIEAINRFFATYEHESIEHFDIVIPLSVPTAIPFYKAIRKTEPIVVTKSVKPIRIVYLNEWGNKPIPDSTVEFKMGMKWVVITPPYDKQNVYFLSNPLPDTYKFASGKGSSYKTLQVIGKALEKDINVDLGWAKVHIFPDGQELRMEFIGGRDASIERWRQVKKTVKTNKPNMSIFTLLKKVMTFS